MKTFKKEKESKMFETERSNGFFKIDKGDNVMAKESKDHIDYIISMCDTCGINIKDLEEYNHALLDEEFLSIPISCLPGDRAEVGFRILCATWKRNAKTEELSRISKQYAKMLQKLRDVGFIPTQKEGSSNFYIDKNFRQFVGWKDPILENRIYITLNPKVRKRLVNNKRDYLTNSRKNIEIDHRTPVLACKKLGKEPAVLTDSILVKKGFDIYKDFQFITNSFNALKREVCAKCVKGEDIKLSAVALDMEKYKGSYKRRWDNLNESTRSCVGCFYFNPKLTQDEYLDSQQNTSVFLIDKVMKQENDLRDGLKQLKEHFDRLSNN